MKKFTLLLIVVFFLGACNSSKKIQKEISNGNYDFAIRSAVKKLRKNPNKKKKQPIIILLEKAYSKAVEEDLRNLEKYKIDSNPAVIEDIYSTYKSLDDRQEFIRPILPLHINKENRDAVFKMENYNQKIEDSKNSLSDFLYARAKELLDNKDIYSARKAYDDLTYLNDINPNFKDVESLLEEAHYMGTIFVKLDLINDTNQIIPFRLEEDLLDIDTYGLDKFWTKYHSNPQEDTDYTFELALLFKQIDISPEKIFEEKIPISKTIKDGFEYLVDDNGHVMLDSLGNRIKVDKFIDVKATLYKIHQEKAARILANVEIVNLQNNQLIDEFPIDREFVFVNDFADLEGDKRALSPEQIELLNQREAPFPTNEQMIYDTGQEIKNSLKEIIDDLEL